jgi:hypothetical protein
MELRGAASWLRLPQLPHRLVMLARSVCAKFLLFGTAEPVVVVVDVVQDTLWVGV